MAEENAAYQIVQDVENLMQDILLSGFSGVQGATVLRLEQYGKRCGKIGLEEGGRLILWLHQELQKGKSSFQGDKEKTARAFCHLEFYLQNAKDQLA